VLKELIEIYIDSFWSLAKDPWSTSSGREINLVQLKKLPIPKNGSSAQGPSYENVHLSSL